MVQRPRTLTDDEKAASLDPPRTKCCVPAPPVLEFDQDGNLVKAWGGPGEGYDWPENEHGIYIDHKGFVWLAGNGEHDGHILKFTRDGKFVMQIGKQGRRPIAWTPRGSASLPNMTVDAAANELYVADGYYNHRVIVFDGDTGAFKRHVGRLRQAADRREAAGLRSRLRRRRRSSAIRSIASRSPATGWSMSATGRTIASRCSARTGPS